MNNVNASFRRNAARTIEAIKSGSKKAAAAGTIALVGAQSAFAQTSGFDEGDVISAITGNVGKAVLVIGAFIVGLWTLKAMGLLKRG